MIFSVDVNTKQDSLTVLYWVLSGQARLSMSQSESLLPAPQMASVSPTTMVSHSASAVPQTEFLSTMTSHRVSYQDNQHHDDDDEDEGDDGYEEDYDEATAVKYSFTLEDNMPVVIQAVGQENTGEDDHDDNNQSCSVGVKEEEEVEEKEKEKEDEEEEEVEAEVRPVKSKLVINIPAGNTVTLNNKEITPLIEEVQDDDVKGEEGAGSTEQTTDNVQSDQVSEDQEKTKKSKILDLLLGCFRFKCREKNKRQ